MLSLKVNTVPEQLFCQLIQRRGRLSALVRFLSAKKSSSVKLSDFIIFVVKIKNTLLARVTSNLNLGFSLGN